MPKKGVQTRVWSASLQQREAYFRKSSFISNYGLPNSFDLPPLCDNCTMYCKDIYCLCHCCSCNHSNEILYLPLCYLGNNEDHCFPEDKTAIEKYVSRNYLHLSIWFFLFIITGTVVLQLASLVYYKGFSGNDEPAYAQSSCNG